jgi:hypothetical protein
MQKELVSPIYDQPKLVPLISTRHVLARQAETQSFHRQWDYYLLD